ncbi:MAG TPA: FAD-dependent oxidoreductase, partial [Pseudonocardiaceae bacterium]|nr:FAD-dependent oxidoreductase [Pseudonocardiaceae bacterium]
LLTYSEPLNHVAALVSDSHYDLPGPAHPLLGHWAPNVPAVVEHMPKARPLLVDTTGKARKLAADRHVDVVEAKGSTSMLIRPDCFVAWASDGGTKGLREALDTVSRAA